MLHARAALRLGRGSCRRLLSSSPFPRVDIFTPTTEHAQLRSLVRAFASEEVEPQALAFNREERFNHPLFRRAGELGLLGASADPAHGGSGLDATAVAIIHEELSAADPAFCLSYLAHSLLFVNNLSCNGSEAQKAAFLPRACAGELLCGMAMSEAGAGTDVLAMGTRAEVSADGATATLTGSKMWITNGAASDTELGDAYLVYARDAAPAGGGKKASFSLFLVEKGMAGFSLGQRIKDKCGMRASNTAELVLDGVRVPTATHRVRGRLRKRRTPTHTHLHTHHASRALGTRAPSHTPPPPPPPPPPLPPPQVGLAGDAVAHMMRNLEVERLALAAMSLGIARRCVEAMVTHGGQRVAFGGPINRFGQVQRHIADSYAEYAAGRAYVYNTAYNMDLSRAGGRLDSDGVKLFATPMATNVASRAIQVLGGLGYCGEYVVERLWRDAKLLEIGGGTVEAHQFNMSRDLAKNWGGRLN